MHHTKFEIFEKKLSYLYNNFPLVYKKRKEDYIKSLKRNYELNYGDKKINIAILGLGGTGSWFLQKIIKMSNKIALQQSIPINLLLIDGDTVSESNLLRQNFLAQDVGQFKSTVLANRYKRFLHPNVTIYHSDKYFNFIDSYKVFEDFTIYTGTKEYCKERSFLFCFIDRPDVVDTIVSNFTYNNHLHEILIVGLNEKVDGHVDIIKSYSDSFYREHSDFKRLAKEYFEKSNKEERGQKQQQEQETCTTISLEEQTYNANDFAATIAATLFSNIIDWKLPDFSTYYFNTSDMTVKPGKTHFDDLQNIILEEEKEEDYETESLSIFTRSS